ncbi:MAG TPA: acetyl-CoA carboxylase biotin carboxyl carrier protein subunit [Bacteroidales bacterium]|nr:acetyl-CoA carboxylase biotin carboxyl carrier protein subunit [Bacteroidales bacterium]
MDSKEKSKYQILEIDDTKYRTLFPKKYENKKTYVRDNPKQITAFIPGIIKKIYVKEGVKVNAGDKILVLEAMKMYNDIVTEVPGKILKINVKVGDHVSKNTILVEII